MEQENSNPVDKCCIGVKITDEATGAECQAKVYFMKEEADSDVVRRNVLNAAGKLLEGMGYGLKNDSKVKIGE